MIRIKKSNAFFTGSASYPTIIKKTAEGILWGATIFLVFIVGFEHLLQIPGWLKVAGRMHPMFLHFPIVLLFMSFLSVWIPSRDESLRQWLNTFRLIAALSAVVTAIMGLLLSLEEDRAGSGLQWHKWSGVAVALMGFAFYAFYSFLHSRILAGRTFTVFASVAILMAGHLGATLTHGENYLLAPLAVKKKIPVTKAIVYDDVIRPVLEAKCFSCHSEANEKGGLLLDHIAGLVAGGKTGPLFVPGNPKLSLLMRRIHLPDQDKKHMPPRAKPQLTEDESMLLETWVRSGALLDKKLTILPVQDTFRILASHALGEEEQAPDQPVYTFAAADSKTIASLNNNFRVLEQSGAGSPAISVHFYGKDMYNSKALEDLLVLKQQIVELSLAKMPVKDNEIRFISQMPNITRLNLNYTDVTGKGIDQLSGMKNLQELALSGTAINVSSLEKILSLPQLRSVFVWNTSIDSVRLVDVRRRFKKVRVEYGYIDNRQEIVNLSPPMFKVPAGIIDLPLAVEIKHPFHGVDIRYTVDGTVPDSINSRLYKGPVQIDSNVTLIARAFKKGWTGSNESRASYIIRGVKADSIELITPADIKYNAGGASVLTDGDLADPSYNNGGWLGYQANDAGYYFYFSNAVNVHQVLLNMLFNTGAAIFPPTRLEVWGGMDKDHLKSLGSISPAMPQKNEASTITMEKICFSPTAVRVIKINATNLAKLPLWHPSKNKPAWLFVSEIVMN